MGLKNLRRRCRGRDGRTTCNKSGSTMMMMLSSVIPRIAIALLVAASTAVVAFQLGRPQRLPSRSAPSVATRTQQAPRCFPSQYYNVIIGKHGDRTLSLSLASSTNRDNLHDDDDDDDDNFASSASSDDDFLEEGPEKSLMTNYISQFLKRELASSQQGQGEETTLLSDFDGDNDDNNSDDDSSQYYTHLVAIPMDNCHELLLELESIQRAILYHCPVLVHACIPQAITRLPLLYVRAPKRDAHTTVTKRLDAMVRTVISKHINLQNSTTTTTAGTTTDEDSDTRPLMMSFATLEIDGNTNQVLQTVAKQEHESTQALQKMVYDLQQCIRDQEPTWNTMLPPDPHSSSNNDDTTTAMDTGVFRPRIPFMRLPQDWDKIILHQHQQEKQQERKDSGLLDMDNDFDDDDEEVFLTSDQGGNGISPIFWCQWWHDEFPESRMREVAIYRRQEQRQPWQQHRVRGSEGDDDATDALSDLNEQAFYMPEKSIPLPMGNASLTKHENKFQDYHEQRMLEAEAIQAQQADDDNEDDEDDSDQLQRQDENDPLFVKTRNRLESLYQHSPSFDDNNALKDVEQDGDSNGIIEPTIVSRNTDSDDQGKDNADVSPPTVMRPVTTSSNDNSTSTLDDWTRERIRQAVASRAKVQSEKELARKKDNLPPIAENNVFNKYKEGTLVPEKEQETLTTRELPPYPSREHCLGFWRVIKSPTGFDVEQDDATHSENLVLRVDGTIAGGPILDQETRQKASGGTWRLTATSEYDATLRIRLIIPPKKDRILVMQGKLNRLSASLSDSSFAMPSSTFGIPALEEKKARAAALDGETGERISCHGEVWLEDAVTGYNRQDVGTFSIMKLETPSDPKAYTITIPRPVRNQD